jgi:hypothetical protein
MPSLSSGWGIQDSVGNELPVRLIQDDGARLVEIVPLLLLEKNSNYTVSIGDVSDSVGNQGITAQSFVFTTGDGIDLQSPALVSTVPEAWQSDVDPSRASIEFQFDSAMDITSLDASNTRLTRVDTGEEISIEFSVDSTFTNILVTPSTAFESGVSYQLRYIGSFYDLGGNRKFLNSTLGFTTQ